MTSTGQCHERITEVDFDIVYSQLALDFWAGPPEAAQPVAEVLRELAAERRRYHAALTQQVRDPLFPDLTQRPAQSWPIPINADSSRTAWSPALVPRSPGPLVPGGSGSHPLRW